MRQYETFELRLTGEVLSGQWADVNLEAAFTCDGETTPVKGFYDGEGQYVVRFLPLRAGAYTWQVSGAVQAEGAEICEPALRKHGPVRAVDTHFEYTDGSLFFPFGTTVYALASQEDALVDQTLETLKAAPFNKVRMCVFPKDYDYNKNEPPYYAFEKRADGSWATERPNIAFWQRFERIMDRIGAMGIQVDLILFHPYDRWGFAKMPREDNLRYLDYLLRRFAAKPYLWWSLANEYDLNMDAKSLADWEEIEKYVAKNDPYRHLLSNHNCMCFWDHIRDVHASMTRPVKELQGFARVPLMPGEIKKVTFTLDPSQTAFLDEDMRWKIEKGEFEVQVGSSSEDIRLKDAFTVTENAWLEGKDRVFYALGKIQ